MMSEVNQYTVNHSDRSERMVLVADFDRVTAERDVLQLRLNAADQRIDELTTSEAALREELAKFDEGMRALACSLGAGGYNAETLTADQLVGKVQWGIDHLLDIHERRLTAAEQRNAELAEALKCVEDRCSSFLREDSMMGLDAIRVTRNIATVALNPTESGAGE